MKREFSYLGFRFEAALEGTTLKISGLQTSTSFGVPLAAVPDQSVLTALVSAYYAGCSDGYSLGASSIPIALCELCAAAALSERAGHSSASPSSEKSGSA